MYFIVVNNGGSLLSRQERTYSTLKVAPHTQCVMATNHKYQCIREGTLVQAEPKLLNW